MHFFDIVSYFCSYRDQIECRFVSILSNVSYEIRHHHEILSFDKKIHTLNTVIYHSNRNFGQYFIEVVCWSTKLNVSWNRHLFSHNARHCVKNPIKLKYFWPVEFFGKQLGQYIQRINNIFFTIQSFPFYEIQFPLLVIISYKSCEFVFHISTMIIPRNTIYNDTNNIEMENVL